jgi:hypothetical protein
MGSKQANYFLFTAGGFIVGALYRIWFNTGFDLDVFHSNPDVAGLLGYGAGGALLGFILCWFL